MKVCATCGESKTPDEFRFTTANRLRGSCKKCEAETRKRSRPKDSNVYLVTYAQNATPLHREFWQNLQAYARERRASVVVLPGRYKNPTSIFTEADEDWWDAEAVPYIYKNRLVLRKSVALHGEISISPTAVRPLTGFEVYTGRVSAVFGHPKIELRTVPTAQRKWPRILTTTGACTVPNYTDSKAGRKAEKHHVLGASVVEFDEYGQAHFRQINAQSNGDFYDLGTLVSGGQVSQSPKRPLALILGDTHVDQLDPNTERATFGSGGIVETLDPESLVFHDVLDFHRRNHHNRGNSFISYLQSQGLAKSDVREEVEDVRKYLTEKAQSRSVYVVSSNHNDAFDRWLLEEDFRKDLKNARFFMESWIRKMDALDAGCGEKPSIQLYIEDGGGPSSLFPIKFMAREEPLVLGGIYLHFHGDLGTNGSRGSISSYARLGVKTVIGHGHAPGIRDGCVQVGVSGKLFMGYNHGPSGWLPTHCLIYPNGKRTLLTCLDHAAWRRE